MRQRQPLPLPHCRLPVLLLLLVVIFVTTSCIAPSTKQVVKIGLLAPFEGPYRNSGYSALAAMRLAIADHQAIAINAHVDILPLALDYSLNAIRTAEKIVADPSVKAVVVPAVALYAPKISSIIAESDVQLVLPQLNAATEESIATAIKQLLVEVAKAAGSNGAKRLVFAGLTSDSLNAAFDWEELFGLPTIVDSDPVTPQQGDAVIWWGKPVEGAMYLNALRSTGANVPFWMGPVGGDPVFAARAESIENVYWAIWQDEAYEPWTTMHQLEDPAAYFVYRATERAIAELTGQSNTNERAAWTVHFYALTPDRQSIPYMPAQE